MDSFHQVFGTNDVGTCCLCFVSLGATGEYSNANGFAGAAWQADNTANHLVGVTGVNTKVHRDFDGFVKFRGCVGFDQGDCFFNGQIFFAYECFACGAGAFSEFCHLT